MPDCLQLFNVMDMTDEYRLSKVVYSKVVYLKV